MLKLKSHEGRGCKTQRINLLSPLEGAATLFASHRGFNPQSARVREFQEAGLFPAPPLSGDQDALPPQPDSSWVNVADIMINRVLFFLLSSLARSGPVREPSIPRKFVLE